MDNNQDAPTPEQAYATSVPSAPSGDMTPEQAYGGGGTNQPLSTPPWYQTWANNEQKIKDMASDLVPHIVKSAISNASAVAPAVMGLAQGPIGAMDTSSAQQIPSLVNQLSQQAGSATAGALGGMMPPQAAAGIGTAVSMAPMLAGLVEGGIESYASKTPLVKGLLNSPSELGADYDAQNAAVGFTKKTPIFEGKNPVFPDEANGGQDPTVPPTVYPALNPLNPGRFFNYVQDRIDQFGDQLSFQELSGMRKGLKTLMDKGKLDPENNATAADLNSQATGLFVKTMDAQLDKVQNLPEGSIPTRADLNEAYSVSQFIHPALAKWLIQGVKKYGPWAVRGAAAGAGIGLTK